MQQFIGELKQSIEGSVKTDSETLKAFSRDASIYELIPDVVVAPKSSKDIQKIVKLVSQNKEAYPNLAITPRSAGTDMSGASIGKSVVLDMTKHFKEVGKVKGDLLSVQPGAYLRDIDPILTASNLMLGSAPASRSICTIGGMVSNNAGGEQSLRYGNTDKWVNEVSAVLADGKEYTFKPIDKYDLQKKMREETFEGNVYRKVYNLIESNYDLIKNARPKVNKNSMGYNLWDVWDRGTGVFDMTKLFSGSQGTLGIITDLTIKAVPKPPHTGLLLAYLPSLSKLGEVTQTVLKHKPSAFEGFDDITFNLGIRYFKTFRKQLGTKELLKQQARLLSSVAKFKGHLPNILLMIEFEGNSNEEVYRKIEKLHDDLKRFKIRMDIEGDEESSAPFWQIRRSALGLLRNQVKNNYASPFIDDMTVQTRYVPEFIPKLRKVIRKYKLPATVQGHFGDGNFHIIPLMDIASQKDQAKLEPVMRELIPIVLKYKGTMAGEHNDGMVRGPWLPAMFGQDVFEIFKEIKEIFDPQYIFNPHKKTDASWDFSMSHIRSDNGAGLVK